jgi:chemotaxis protein histidine kinase CheA
MNPPVHPATHQPTWRERAEPWLQAFMRAFRRYANWLVSISWKRFFLLALLLLLLSGMVQSLLTWRVTETVDVADMRPPKRPRPPAPPAAPATPEPPKVEIARSDTPAGDKDSLNISISVGKDGVRIRQRQIESPAGSASGSASAPAAADSSASAAASAATAASHDDGALVIRLPKKADREAVREVISEVKDAIREAVQSQQEAGLSRHEADLAKYEAELARYEAAIEDGGTTKRTRVLRMGESLPELAFLWIVMSALIKATYKGRLQAEVKAARATETAEAESLRRQVVEARMAAMQAQVEPHFLFNTLASIDHLIETDPARASTLQKHLIALLRASMPTMREASDGGPRELAREVAVIRPYLEILKARMEERLHTELDIPEGLHSAEFPPMMIQTLVENAVKHGLEPKPDGGTLKVKAEIVHGKLVVTVADTGLGFGKAATAGTGVGLANVRERLQLLYGNKASLTVAENTPTGTIAIITVPYKILEGQRT